MDELTLQMLKDMVPGPFAHGITIDNASGVNVANTGNHIKWVAVRGDIYDWAIYCDNPYTPFESLREVATNGDKITSENHIKKLVPCDDEAFKMFRY